MLLNGRRGGSGSHLDRRTGRFVGITSHALTSLRFVEKKRGATERRLSEVALNPSRDSHTAAHKQEVTHFETAGVCGVSRQNGFQKLRGCLSRLILEVCSEGFLQGKVVQCLMKLR